MVITEYSQNSEAEDLEPVDCKVEDSGYSIPASPTWSTQGTPTSPIDNSFHGSSLYQLGPVHSSTGTGSGSVYSGRGNQNEKWPAGPTNESNMLSPLHRQDMSWSPPGPVLSSAHTMRRRDGSVIQSDWPSLHPRWQGQQTQQQQSHVESPSSTGALYQDRQRIRPNQLYDDNTVSRRDHHHHHAADSNMVLPNFPLRYPPHCSAAGTQAREGALQRLHWHSRDTPDNTTNTTTTTRDPRRCHHPQNSFSSSPTLPFSPQGYHTNGNGSNNSNYSSSSWTSTDNNNNLMNTPTLHSITQSPLSYDGYSSNSASIPSPDEFTNVDGYRDA